MSTEDFGITLTWKETIKEFFAQGLSREILSSDLITSARIYMFYIAKSATENSAHFFQLASRTLVNCVKID